MLTVLIGPPGSGKSTAGRCRQTKGHAWEIDGVDRLRRWPRGVDVQRNRSIPPASVIPVLVYPDVRAAVSWLTTTFGFVERTRVGENHRAQMGIGETGAVIVADVHGEQRAPEEGVVTHLIKVRVDDVDAVFSHARAHGARVLEAPTEQVYGERECTLEDLAGHRWQFSQTVRDVAPEEYGCETVSPWPGG